MKRLFWIMWALFFAGVATAGPVTVPLPGLAGYYQGSSTSRSTSFDAGVTFTHIRSVRAACYGTYSPGLLCTVSYPLQYSIWNGTFFFEIPKTSAMWYARILPSSDCFSGQSVFSAYNDSSNWDFLLDGIGDITLSLPMNVYLAIYTPVYPATGQIYGAQIIIDGTQDRIDLEAPSTREYLLGGSVYSVRWRDMRFYDGNCGSYLLYYSLDDGQTWTPITTEPIVGICQYQWQLPDVTAEFCRIKVQNIEETVMDISDESFAIYECSSSPAGDFSGDCYVNLRDFNLLAVDWQTENGYFLDDLITLAEEWLDCANTLDLRCQ